MRPDYRNRSTEVKSVGVLRNDDEGDNESDDAKKEQANSEDGGHPAGSSADQQSALSDAAPGTDSSRCSERARDQPPLAAKDTGRVSVHPSVRPFRPHLV